MPTEETTYRRSIDQKLEQILAQTTKTNGRVSKLERWQSYVVGFCAALSVIMLPILFLLLKTII